LKKRFGLCIHAEMSMDGALKEDFNK